MKGRTRQSGYTLVEIMVSILLTAIMVSAVFSVAVTTRAGGGKADRKLLGSQASKALTSALKGYVTQDTNTPVTGIPGPNFRNAGAATWSLQDTVQTDSQGAVYALAAGVHTISCIEADPGRNCFLPLSMRAAPYNGTLTYRVSYPATGGPFLGEAPRVDVSVNWDEP